MPEQFDLFPTQQPEKKPANIVEQLIPNRGDTAALSKELSALFSTLSPKSQKMISQFGTNPKLLEKLIRGAFENEEKERAIGARPKPLPEFKPLKKTRLESRKIS